MANCIRCHKDLILLRIKKDKTVVIQQVSDERNADYVIADEFTALEKREHLYAISEDVEGKEENVRTRVNRIEDSQTIDKLKRVEVVVEDEAVQKTGLICPECFNPATDFVIWGIHKGEGLERAG